MIETLDEVRANADDEVFRAAEEEESVIGRIVAARSGRNWSGRSPDCRTRPNGWQRKRESWRVRCYFERKLQAAGWTSRSMRLPSSSLTRCISSWSWSRIQNPSPMRGKRKNSAPPGAELLSALTAAERAALRVVGRILTGIGINPALQLKCCLGADVCDPSGERIEGFRRRSGQRCGYRSCLPPSSSMSFIPSRPESAPFPPLSPPPVMRMSGMTLTFSRPMISAILLRVKLSPPMASTWS